MTNMGKKISIIGSFATLFFVIGSSIQSEAHAFSLVDGDLNVDIVGDNGAIDRVVFAGRDFYDPGLPVSDWIFQVGTDTSTFRSNTTRSDADDIGVTAVVSNNDGVLVTGNYTAGGVNIGFLRNYSLLPGLNTLRTTTELTNLGADTTISLVDTFDPDQDAFPNPGSTTFDTINDAFPVVGTNVATAVGPNSGSTVAFSSNLRIGFTPNSIGIFNGSNVNSFFSGNIFDPNASSADIGLGIGTRQFLATGDRIELSFDQTYSVPEPITVLGSAFVFGMGLLLKKTKYKNT